MASKQAGVPIARFLAAIAALSAIAILAIEVHGFGVDHVTLAIVGWGAMAIAWVGGWIAALALARQASRTELRDAVVVMATARGLSSRAFAWAEIAACIELTFEVVCIPIAVLVVVAGAVIVAASSGGLSHALAGPGRVLAGTMVFALVASALFGIPAGCCRQWGGRYGRLWFVAILLAPWLLGELGWAPGGKRWWSLLGLLVDLWRTLVSA